MAKKKEKSPDIMIRLNLSEKDDQPLYDFFHKIKKNLGIKQNTEVARLCIKKAYELWFVPKFEEKK
ncbi:MAG: hypothetical protein JXA99_01145 [Candidatus Lokiarchaeota archaeon]|nr:hypothetical protein [Candidatus Lokiarchaeota archaeon]